MVSFNFSAPRLASDSNSARAFSVIPTRGAQMARVRSPIAATKSATALKPVLTKTEREPERGPRGSGVVSKVRACVLSLHSRARHDRTRSNAERRKDGTDEESSRYVTLALFAIAPTLSMAQEPAPAPPTARTHQRATMMGAKAKTLKEKIGADIAAAKSLVLAGLFVRIPYSTEQGILITEQGIFSTKRGIFCE